MLYKEPLILDAMFDAWRSPVTGHRVYNGDGSRPVPATRTLPVRMWPFELLHRHLARKAGANGVVFL